MDSGSSSISDVVAFATQGPLSQDAERIRSLLDFSAKEWVLDPRRKARAALGLLRRLRRERPTLVVMEGTGMAGGLPLMLAARLWGIEYVVSSGDAVGPYLSMRGGRILGLAGFLYEAALYGNSAGVIGWSPYIVGRAVSFGAPRGVTAENWAGTTPRSKDRERVRRALGIPDDAVVYGIAGSINWNPAREYAYGLELVKARTRVSNPAVYVLILGAGSGVERLSALAGEHLGATVLMPGRVQRDEVPAYLSAMDYGILPQSTDRVGSLRYTTKISEYFAAGLPVISTEIPAAYDVIGDAGVRLPGNSPWSETFIAALADHMEHANSTSAARSRRFATPAIGTADVFSRDRQVARVHTFVVDILERIDRGKSRAP